MPVEYQAKAGKFTATVKDHYISNMSFWDEHVSISVPENAETYTDVNITCAIDDEVKVANSIKVLAGAPAIDWVELRMTANKSMKMMVRSPKVEADTEFNFFIVSKEQTTSTMTFKGVSINVFRCEIEG